MKRNYRLLVIVFLLSALHTQTGEWIQTSQLGCLPQSKKVAVFMSEVPVEVDSCSLVDVLTGKTVCTFTFPRKTGPIRQMRSTYRLDFSTFDTPGTYYLRAGKIVPPHFPISHHVCNGTAGFLLNHMRQQQRGYDPFLKDSRHVHDGFIVYHPTEIGQYTDVRGGQHDTTDYLQYTTTSANAIYQMMFAYLQNPKALGDAYDAAEYSGADGIPDIADGIKWGPDRLNQMNPAQGELYNQITDDRGHVGMRLPSKDPVGYGYG